MPPHSRWAIYRFDRMRSTGRSRYGQVVRNSVTPSIVLFSFVDQPLANPGASAFRGAARTLEQLAVENIPLVLCSSKTRAQLECIRDRLGISAPFICEHGAAVMIPAGYFELDLPNTRKLAGYEARRIRPSVRGCRRHAASDRWPLEGRRRRVRRHVDRRSCT